MSDNGQRNGWSNWVLGIVASLVLVAIVGSIIFERDVAKMLGEHEIHLRNLATRIDEKTVSRFTRDDFEREMRGRDADRARVERRLDQLEKR